MSNIGYCVRPKLENLGMFTVQYGKFFDTMEVKLTEELLLKAQMGMFADFCSEHGIKFLSYHLPEDALKSEEACSKSCDFMMTLRPKQVNTLVTHFYGNSFDADKLAFAISNTAKGNGLRIAIENVEFRKPLIPYLKALKEFAIQNDFLVCLDIGHLFYSALASKTNAKEVMGYLITDDWWKERVCEIHIHDYNYRRSHLNIGKGRLGTDAAKTLLQHFCDTCPIILQTTVDDLSVQGVEEAKYLRERMKI